MPLSLTPVCRQWYNLIHATPILWFRIVIDVCPRKSIPSILSSTGFRQYLARTNGQEMDAEFPLDIEIRCHAPSKKEHSSMCGINTYGGLWCFQSTCGFVRERRKQLDALLDSLANVLVTKAESYAQVSAHNTGPGSIRRSTINRWRSLVLESYGSFEMHSDLGCESWMNNPLNCASRLLHLTIRGVPSYYEPHKGFAPNLVTLTLADMPGAWKYVTVTIPSLKFLSISQPNGRIPGSGICPVEELSIAEDWEGGPKLNIKFPNLKRLKIYTTLTNNLLFYMSRRFDESDRRLELVHLVNRHQYKFWNPFFNTTILTNAQKIIFETWITNPNESAWNQPTLLDVKEFLELCAPDTEIVVIDNNSAKSWTVSRTHSVDASTNTGTNSSTNTGTRTFIAW